MRTLHTRPPGASTRRLDPECWLGLEFSALEPLSNRHSKAQGWSRNDLGPYAPSIDEGHVPGPGDLFFSIGDVVMSNDILRVAVADEREGLDSTEHGAQGYAL
jgi:hypothetical protein